MAHQVVSPPVDDTRPPFSIVDGVPLLYECDAPLRPLEWFGDVPLLYEDEEGAVGETNPHLTTNVILYVCLSNHFPGSSPYQVFSDLNLYYPPRNFPQSKANPNVAPDTMVVEPYRRLDASTSSYTVGKDGPAPKLAIEVLSKRTFRQRDLDDKVTVYRHLGVEEYILADVTGLYLPEKLILKRLQPDRTYRDERDADGGVTSKLGFRLLIDQDGQLRVQNSMTHQPYVRPLEMEAVNAAAREALERAQQLEAEIARLRATIQNHETPDAGS